MLAYLSLSRVDSRNRHIQLEMGKHSIAKGGAPEPGEALEPEHGASSGLDTTMILFDLDS